MDKAQALHDFWSSFGIPAFDESTVPEKIWDEELQKEVELKPPYITYAVSESSLDGTILLSASVWYHGYGWSEISRKVAEIAEKLGSDGFYSVKVDGGYLWMTQGTPFAQRMSDPEDDMIRRYILTINAEFLTAY